MTVGDLRRLIESLPDDAPFGVVLADGRMQYDLSAWVESLTEDGDETPVATLVIATD